LLITFKLNKNIKIPLSKITQMEVENLEESYFLLQSSNEKPS